MKLLFFLQFKRAIKAVPKLIAGALLPLLIAGMAIFVAKNQSSDTSSSVAPVALVNQDTPEYFDFVYPFIAESEAGGSFSFLLLDEKEAMEALKDGTVCAVLLLPDQMFSGIIDATNIPARLYLPEKDSFSSLLVAKFAEAGALTLGSSQAGIYAASDLYTKYELSDYLSDIYYDINLVNIKYALARESAFSTKSTTTKEEVSLVKYYGCTVFVCLLIFLGAGMGSFLCNALPRHLSDQLKRNGIGIFALELSLLLPLLLYYLFIVFVLSKGLAAFIPEINSLYHLNFFLLCIALCLTAYTQFVFTLFKNAGRGLLAFSFLGLFMIFISGGFLPYAFLPASFYKLTPYLPFGSCLTGLRKIIGGTLTIADCTPLLYHSGALFLCLCVLLFVRRKERTA